jgi:hypothetical protein
VGYKADPLCVESALDVISVTAKDGFIAYMVRNEYSKQE